MIKHLVVSLLFTLAGLWLLSVLLHQPELFAAFGFHLEGVGRPSSHAALVILSLLAGPAGAIVQPLASAWTRRHEYEADRYAAHAVGGDEALAGALIALSRDQPQQPQPASLVQRLPLLPSHPGGTAARVAPLRLHPGAGTRLRRRTGSPWWKPAARAAGGLRRVASGCDRRVASRYNERVPCRPSRAHSSVG